MERIISILLILLWTYVGFDKIIRFEASRKAFHNQAFPAELAEVLAYTIPIVELPIALLLLFSVKFSNIFTATPTRNLHPNLSGKFNPG